MNIYHWHGSCPYQSLSSIRPDWCIFNTGMDLPQMRPSHQIRSSGQYLPLAFSSLKSVPVQHSARLVNIYRWHGSPSNQSLSNIQPDWCIFTAGMDLPQISPCPAFGSAGEYSPLAWISLKSVPVQHSARLVYIYRWHRSPPNQSLSSIRPDW